MNVIELLDIISAGETSRVQFKEKITSPDQLAAEMVAMSNSLGGMILVGVKDRTGERVGLSYEETQKTQMLVGNVATDKVIPLVYVQTEVVILEEDNVKKNILIVYVKEGISKPYKDKNLVVWLKQGSDKRRVTDNNELLRLFQNCGNLQADEMEIANTSISDVNVNKLSQYVLKALDKPLEEVGLSIEQVAANINILRNDRLTLAGLLFFGKNPQKYRQSFCIKAVSFFGNDIEGTEYRDSKDIEGTIPELFEKGMDFFVSNLKQTQQGQNFNSIGILEISRIALEEVLQNALIHRDYLKYAPIRAMIFDNRIELTSPGTLPNSLTVENIIAGNAVVRNNLLASYCVKIMPYRGFGSGVRRAIKEQPNIKFFNDVEGEQFTVTIPRPEIS